MLSAEVASYLGLELGKIKIKRFADGEIYVQVQVRSSTGRAWNSMRFCGCGKKTTQFARQLRLHCAVPVSQCGSRKQPIEPLHLPSTISTHTHTVLPVFVVRRQESIRGCDVFLVQPTCPPVNDNLMELLVTIDACRRASARSITAVLPYYGYARADRKTQVRMRLLLVSGDCPAGLVKLQLLWVAGQHA